MDFPASALVVALALAGCGGARPGPVAETAPSDEDERATVHPPELIWARGAPRVTVRGVGVTFTVDAPIARLAIDEVATSTCGDRMVHAMVVDRRRAPAIDSILGRALMRAGCEIPEEGQIVSMTGDLHERVMVVRFDGGSMDGEWALRAVQLHRAHRSVAIVSALRVAPGTAPVPLFEIVADAPGLEGVGVPLQADAPGTNDAQQVVDAAFGVVEVVGGILRIFSP